ncbi:hypothetical protein PsorP6_001450 [Peronosclerospora sorghi]|uniref:Uncharacterized protein n=1 Tax=Peronosclerospora sorghi TaxID=230839 RepID=A0ACC0WTA9_9STRA|nr:hypothetical protein PsorP6_001450 [Peronosclerospora sorghi]
MVPFKAFQSRFRPPICLVFSILATRLATFLSSNSIQPSVYFCRRFPPALMRFFCSTLSSGTK